MPYTGCTISYLLQSLLKRFFGAFLRYLINRPIRSKAIFILSGSLSSSGSPPISAKLLSKRAKNRFKMTKFATKTDAKKYGTHAGPVKLKK